MGSSNFQEAFVEKLLVCGSTQTIVATLMPLLKQSKGNVYKKLRLEVPFRIDELLAVSKHFAISIDQILGIETNKTSGQIEKQIEVMQVVTDFETMTAYLQQAHSQLLVFRQMPNFEMTYIARDIPLFYYFAYPELGALKAITWVHESLTKKMKITDVPSSLLQKGAELYEFYKTTCSTEIWSLETINNTLKNVLYYTRSGVISKSLAQQILHQLGDLLNEQRNLVEQRKAESQNTKTFIHSPFIMMSNGALMHIGEHSFGMLSISSIQTLIIHHPVLLQSLKTSISWHLANGTLLHNSSQDVISEFYSKMSGKLTETRADIKSI